MSDVRELLRRKREETLVNHPYASYASNGQLRCIACGAVKPEQWAGHIGSKAHRIAVSRSRAEENSKMSSTHDLASVSGTKRSQTADEHSVQGRATKKPKAGVNNELARTGLPLDADPTIASFEDAEVADTNLRSKLSKINAKSAYQIAIPDGDLSSSTLDLEWEMFQASISPVSDKTIAFDQATIFAEAMPAQTTTSIFPLTGVVSTLTDANRPDTLEAQNEERLRLKREEDDRELIMDRLIEVFNFKFEQ